MNYRFIAVGELTPELFSGFIRRQVVDKCVRREQGKWVIKSHPFVDDWTENDYAVLIAKLKRIMCGGGFVLAAFDGDVLKAFSAVDGNLFGRGNMYADLAEFYVSEDYRRQGVGSRLFAMTADAARSLGAKKLYISAHSAAETQAFYRGLGCLDAREILQFHADKEPYDCQLEYILDPNSNRD